MANTVILKNTSVPDKVQLSGTSKVGEVYVNYASGDGKSFLSTMKADNTIALFHEDAYWNDRLFKRAVLTCTAQFNAEGDDFRYDTEFPIVAASSCTYAEWIEATQRTVAIVVGDETYVIDIAGCPSSGETWIAPFHYQTFNAMILVNYSKDAFDVRLEKNVPTMATITAKTSVEEMNAKFASGDTTLELEVAYEVSTYNNTWADADIKKLVLEIYSDSGHTQMSSNPYLTFTCFTMMSGSTTSFYSSPLMLSSSNTYIDIYEVRTMPSSAYLIFYQTRTVDDNLVTSAKTYTTAINELKERIDNITSTDTYELTIDDDGIVSCIKNSTEEGFQIDENGVVSLA